MSKKLTEIEKLKNKNVRALASKAKKAPKVQEKAPKVVETSKEEGIYLGKDPLTGEKLYK